jgi:hypothetical protein
MSKEDDFRDFALRFAAEAGTQMRLLFDKIDSLQHRAETAEATIAMAVSRLGECHTGNFLQRIDILRNINHLFINLHQIIDREANEVVFDRKEDAEELTELLERCQKALESYAS